MHPVAQEPLSYSRVSEYKKCPLSFRYKYVDRLPEPPSQAMFLGSVVHAALETVFKRPPLERSEAAAIAEIDPAIDALLAADPAAAVAIDSNLSWPDPTQAPAPQAVAAFRARAIELIGRYFKLEDPTDVDVVGLEKYVSGEIAEGVQIHGYIDRLDRAEDGSLVVADYKTGKAPNPRFADDKWVQLRIYAALLALEGETVSRLRLHFLGGDSPRTLETFVDPADLAAVGHEISYYARLIRRSLDLRDFEAKRGRLCDWCNFQANCPAFGKPALPLPY